MPEKITGPMLQQVERIEALERHISPYDRVSLFLQPVSREEVMGIHEEFPQPALKYAVNQARISFFNKDWIRLMIASEDAQPFESEGIDRDAAGIAVELRKFVETFFPDPRTAVHTLDMFLPEQTMRQGFDYFAWEGYMKSIRNTDTKVLQSAVRIAQVSELERELFNQILLKKKGGEYDPQFAKGSVQ